MDQGTELAEQFADVARQLGQARDLSETLQLIVDLAVSMIEACDHAGIARIVEGQVETLASSDGVPARIDRLQSETEQGPCIDAIRRHEVVEARDLETERRWPDFAERAVERIGIRSVLSMRLFVDEATLGALNNYAEPADAFTDEDRSIVSIFAAHAAVAMHCAQEREGLREAIMSRDIIGQAKGILMALQQVDEETAFTLLRGASSRLNHKVRDVAQSLIDRTTQD